MEPRPVALGFTEGLTPIEELVKRVEAGHHDFAIMLAGGLALSRKTIHYDAPDTWHITNGIDGTRQTLPEAGLWESSHIGLALDRNALLDMMGNDGIVNVEGRGWVAAAPWLDEQRSKTIEWLEARAKERAANPLRYTLSDGPGAIRMNALDDDGMGHWDWEPANPSLLLEVCEIGPATVASIDLAAACMGFPDGTIEGDRCTHAATTSIELTIEDIDDLIATLTAIKWDAIENRGFAPRAKDGLWTNGIEEDFG